MKKSTKANDTKGFGHCFFWVVLRAWMNDMAKLLISLGFYDVRWCGIAKSLISLGGACRLHDCGVIVKC